MADKLICIHGHFYQPPRENPWLEAVEVEDSAAPFHDWNQRVNAECYAANAAARALDERGRIAALVNTYEFLSFDFGPTLLSWLEDADPQTYEAVLEADRRSVKAHGGHGNAMAQAYNHVILPLASRRDKQTQIRWGIADFVHRFGRQPEGMWLPETAADTPSLEVLAEEGMRFALLAPHQAAATRPIGDDGPWKPVPASGIDTTRPYLCRLPSGRQISLFFYEGEVSRAVAFEGLLADGTAFTQRLLDRFDPKALQGTLVHIATDGESYGHHHKYGDMALAYTLRALDQEPELRLTNYGEGLELLEPLGEVQIEEQSSWSCAHGVGRWSEDCGCRISGGQQQWRATLRASLDWLRDEIDALFEQKATSLLRDPWLARDRYIEVILDRSGERVDRFLDEHSTRRLEHFDRVDALSLLEMERHRMLMFTSCGWFFDDCAGIESVQILKYAARAIQLASGFGATGLEKRFVDRLAKMESNDPAAGDGADIYQQRVRPTIVDLRRVVSHHAITRLFEQERQDEREIYCYWLRDLDWNVESYGGTHLAVGRVRVQSQITSAIDDLCFGLLHFGGHDFNCSLRGAVTVASYDAMRDDLLQTYREESITDVIHGFDRYFEGRFFGLNDLFVEGRRSVLATVTEGVLAEMERTYDHYYEEHRRLFDLLRAASAPLPDAFTRTVEFALERRLVAAFSRLKEHAKSPDASLTKLESLADEVQLRGVSLSQETMGPTLTSAIDAIAERLLPRWSASTIAALKRTLALGESLQISPTLWDVQNAVISALEQRPPKGKRPRKEVESLLELLGISAEIMSPRQAKR